MSRIVETQKPASHFRWLLLAAGVLLIIAAVAFRFTPYFAESTSQWVFNSIVKVAIMLFAASLAWPQMQRLNRSRYGKIILGSIVALAAIFIVRPKASAAILPLIGVAAAIIAAITFLKDFFPDER